MDNVVRVDKRRDFLCPRGSFLNKMLEERGVLCTKEISPESLRSRWLYLC